MPLWIFLLIAAVCAVIILGPWAKRTAKAWAYQWRHAKHTLAEAEAEFGPPDTAFRGSMNYYDEYPERAGHFPPREEWNRSHADNDGGWDHRTALHNGHTWGCLTPEGDHPGACPEEGDWPDDWPVLDLPPDRPLAAGPDLVDAALALAAEDPADAGWTDQLLADLHDAPTVLDGGTIAQQAQQYLPAPYPPAPGPRLADEWGSYLERLADTGELHLAGLRADWAAELDDQDDDAAEFISRMATDAAEYRLSVNGLA